VKRPLAAGEALADDLGGFVDEDCHGVPFERYLSFQSG
jgi:hypothetical protein